MGPIHGMMLILGRFGIVQCPYGSGIKWYGIRIASKCSRTECVWVGFQTVWDSYLADVEVYGVCMGTV